MQPNLPCSATRFSLSAINFHASLVKVAIEGLAVKVLNFLHSTKRHRNITHSCERQPRKTFVLDSLTAAPKPIQFWRRQNNFYSLWFITQCSPVTALGLLFFLSSPLQRYSEWSYKTHKSWRLGIG